MIPALALLVLLAASPAPAPRISLDEARRALAAGRVDQAGEMIAAARRNGMSGEALQRLEADQSLAKGDHERALSLYGALLKTHPNEAALLERAGRAALRSGRLDEATAFLDRATMIPGAGWSAWNLRGVAADRRKAFDEADSAYARAASLAPTEAAIANNRGWSLMLRGRWSEAEALFVRGLQQDPRVAHGAANLELARVAMAGELPARNAGESDSAFAARLNDVGVVAAATGDRARAIAAFTRAIDSRSRYYERAAENLKQIAEAK